MISAFSRLPDILRKRQLTVPELHRQLEDEEMGVNIKSLYRLNDSHQPISRLDLRVAGAICSVCNVGLSELVDFGPRVDRLKKLPRDAQRRLDQLMDKNNEGKLTAKERKELEALVRQTQEMTLHNARLLVQQQRRMKKA